MTPPASFPDYQQPHSQATTSLIPRLPPTSFPGYQHPHSQATTSLIPGYHQPHSQATTSLIPRLPAASFPGYQQPHSRLPPASSCVIPKPLPALFPVRSGEGAQYLSGSLGMRQFFTSLPFILQAMEAEQEGAT